MSTCLYLFLDSLVSDDISGLTKFTSFLELCILELVGVVYDDRYSNEASTILNKEKGLEASSSSSHNFS